MDIEVMSALFSAATFICVWLFNKPQKVQMEAMREKWEAENKALHETLNEVVQAIRDLTKELQDSRVDRVAINEKIKTLFSLYQTLQTEMESIRSEMMKCRRGENNVGKD